MPRADPDQAPEPGAGEQEGGEGSDEAGGDRVWPPLRAGAAAREHDRQDGQDAGRDCGDDSRRERDRDEDEHVL